MENELRQAYKAVCTKLTITASEDSPIYVNVLNLDNNSYARIFWSFNKDNTELSMIAGRAPEQIGYSTNRDDIAEVLYSGNKIYLKLTNTGTLSVKTEIVYGSVKSFPEIAEEKPSNTTTFNLAKDSGIVKIENNEDGNQTITAPGGIKMDNAAGTFQELNVTSALNVIEGGTAYFIQKEWTTEKTKSETPPGSLYTLRQYIHKTIEADYIYDGSYEQNQ